MFSGRTVHCTVNTALPSLTKGFLDSAPGLDNHVSANLPGQLAAVPQGFHSPDSSCLGGSLCGHSQKPNRSRANDHCRFARTDRRQTEGMQSNRERFRQSRFSELHPGGDGTKVGNWQVDQLTEKTGMVRVAQKAKVRAHVVQPAQTELAMIAIKRRLKRPAVVHSESRDTGACLHDPSCWLVPEDHRVDIGSAPTAPSE